MIIVPLVNGFPPEADCPKTNSLCLPLRLKGSKNIVFKDFNFEPLSL